MAFNLEAAKAGLPLRDGAGRDVQFVAHVTNIHPKPVVVVVIDNHIATYTEDGWYLDDKPGLLDIHTHQDEEGPCAMSFTG